MSSTKHNFFLRIYEHITIRNFVKAFSNLFKLSTNNASAGKKKRIASLTPLVPDFFLFSRPFNPREVSREIRSLIFHGPRLHANNAIKRFEYRPDNALSTASSQPFLPFFFLARSFTICMENQPPRPSLFIEKREGRRDWRLWSIRWRGINRDTREIVRSEVRFNRWNCIFKLNRSNRSMKRRFNLLLFLLFFSNILSRYLN